MSDERWCSCGNPMDDGDDAFCKPCSTGGAVELSGNIVGDDHECDNWFEAVKWAVENKSYVKVEGFFLDLFSASVVKTVYEALSPESQAKALKMSLPLFVDFAWKHVA